MKLIVFAENLLLGELISEALSSAGHEAGKNVEISEGRFTYEGEDVFLVAISSRSETQIESIRMLRKQVPDIPIVVQCPTEMVDDLVVAFGDEVNAIIPDNQAFEVLVGCLCVAQSGITVTQENRIASPTYPEVSRTHDAGMPSLKSKKLTSPLSTRELSILSKVSDGFANKDIARALGISDSTVKVHLRSIYQKVGVKNRTQAALWARSQSV